MPYLDGKFVASSEERIEQAKRDWKQGRIEVPGHEVELVPVPE
jgi:hypothetical protein